MSEPSPPPTSNAGKATPLKCLSGALVASSLGLLLYRLTAAIAHSFAAHPLTTTNQIAHGLSAAVRTLVVGMSTLATGIFSIAALGLIGLGIQLAVQGRSALPPAD
jgi:Protein of unknown function (DUF3082)